MRIRGWHVEGFGILADCAVSDLPAGLVLVHGDNEAGKSTLLAFLRGVLFGFPSGRSEQTYPPLRGGRHGGSLRLEGSDGVYRLERFAGRRSQIAIVRPDGSEGTETDLAALLGGADRHLFKSVFAFSLQELAGMDALSSDQIRARIFSAGVAGAGRSARGIIDRLTKEDGELLGPRSGRIRDLVRDAERLQSDIARARHRAADYHEALRSEGEKEQDVASLRQRLRHAETMARRFGTLIELWEIESQRQQRIQALSDLPEIESFPLDPDTRLTTALANLDAVRHAAADVHAKLAELTTGRASVQTDDRLARVASTAERLAGECVMQRDRLSRVVHARRDADAAQEAVRDVLGRLGAAWTEQRLPTVDASLPAAEEVRSWQQRLRQTEEGARKALDDLASRGRAIGAIDDGLARLAGAVPEGEDKTTEEWIRSMGDRLARVAEAIGQAEGRAVNLLSDPKSIERAAETLAAAHRHREGIRLALTRAREAMRSVAACTGLAALRDRVADAARHVEMERQRLRDIAKLEEDARRCENLVEGGIRDLGAGCSENTVQALATDLGQLREIRDFSDRIDRAHDQVVAAARELDHVGKGRSAREKDLERVRTQLNAPEPMAKADLELQARAIRKLRLRLGELAVVESETKAEARSKADAQADTFVPRREPALLSASPWLVAGIAVLLLAAGGWRLQAHDAGSAVVLFAAGVVALALAAMLRSAARTAAIGDEGKTRRERRLADLDARIAALGVRADQLRVHVADEARVLGLPAHAALEEVEDRQERWAADNEARRNRDALKQQVRDLEEEVESWRRSEEGRRAEHEQAQRLMADVTGQWEAWLSERRLPAGMTPDAARDFLDQMRSVQGRIAERDAVVGRLTAERQAWNNWTEQVATVLRAAGERWALPAGGRESADRLLELQRHCEEDGQLARQRAALADEIADWETKLARADEAVAGAEREAASALAASVARIADEWRRGEPARKAASDHLVTTAAESDHAKRQWNEWLATHGLDASLSPEGVIDFFALVAEARRAIARREAACNDAAILRAAINEWQAQVRTALRSAGLSGDEREPHAWVEAARDLSTRCRADAAARLEAARLDEELQAAAGKLRRLQAGVDERERELAALLGEAGVSDADAFRSRLAAYRQREKLKEAIADLQARILAVLGRGEDADALHAQLATGHLGDWTTARDGHAADAQVLTQQHEAAIREHENLVVARRQLEEACDLADLELQLQGVRAELAAAVHRRRVVCLSARLLQDTLGEYERERQPRVLANATRSFASVTAGRYPLIVQTEDQDGIAVLDSAGRRHGLQDLSRGTQEQLYLSMRLGLAREFGQRAVALPLVMDDVLVNFDQTRARRMGAELLEFAEDNQVLLFTCHEFVRSLLLELDPCLRVIDMPVQAIPGEAAAGSSASRRETATPLSPRATSRRPAASR